jgi:hypothetical protein
MKLLILTSLIMTAAAVAETVNFDEAKTGTLPANWISGSTGGGLPKWSVEADATAPSKPNVLKQSGEGKYPWCVKKDVSIKNGFVEVKFKPLSGKDDQAGGLVWRRKDSDNYYVARANALENNVCIYHTIDGKRTEKKRVELPVSTSQWHTLRVDFSGNNFKVSFDGKPALEWQDDSFREAGAVGVWTKADSVTLFDDFTFRSE